MATVRGSTRTAPREWWKHLDWRKREFWKGERQAWRAAIPDLLEDDYTIEEFMADSCEDDNPCAWCRAGVAKRKLANEYAPPAVSIG